MNKKKSKKGVRTLFAKKNEPGLFLKTASFLIAVVSLIVAVVSLIVASKNLRINEKSHENHPLVTQIGDVEIPYISNSYVYEIFLLKAKSMIRFHHMWI